MFSLYQTLNRLRDFRGRPGWEDDFEVKLKLNEEQSMKISRKWKELKVRGGIRKVRVLKI